MWDSSDHYDYTILIECKFHDDPVSQSVVDSVNGYFQRSDADKAVIVSKSGFQSGAIERAEGTGVELLTLRRFIPGTDLAVDTFRYLDTNLEITDRDLEVLDMDVESLNENSDAEQTEVHVTFNRTNSQLYTTDREPLEETLLDQLTELKYSMEVGDHTKEFEDIALLIEGHFFELHSIDYRITETTSTIEFMMDIFEDVDLFYRDELTGDEEYSSLSDALETFQEHVNNNS